MFGHTAFKTVYQLHPGDTILSGSIAAAVQSSAVRPIADQPQGAIGPAHALTVAHLIAVHADARNRALVCRGVADTAGQALRRAVVVSGTQQDRAAFLRNQQSAAVIEAQINQRERQFGIQANGFDAGDLRLWRHNLFHAKTLRHLEAFIGSPRDLPPGIRFSIRAEHLHPRPPGIVIIEILPA
jgi:hypothetical protein